jgi:hypothetical protein
MLAVIKVGLMPDGGASALVAAAIGRIRAMRMALLAERLPAAEALACGLIGAVYPSDDFGAEVDKVVSALISAPAVAFAKTKEASNAATLIELESALERELQGQGSCYDHTISSKAQRRSSSGDPELHRFGRLKAEQRRQREHHDQAPHEVGQYRCQHSAGRAALERAYRPENDRGESEHQVLAGQGDHCVQNGGDEHRMVLAQCGVERAAIEQLFGDGAQQCDGEGEPP